jgi:hypothetical protein
VWTGRRVKDPLREEGEEVFSMEVFRFGEFSGFW